MSSSSPIVSDLVGSKRKRANSDGDLPASVRVDFGSGSPALVLDDEPDSERPEPPTRENFIMRNKIWTWPILCAGGYAGVFAWLISIPALHSTMSSVSGCISSIIPGAVGSKLAATAVGAAFAGSLIGLAVGVCALLVCALYNKWLSSKSDASADIRQPLVDGQNDGLPTVVAPVMLILESDERVANPGSDISMV